MRLAPSRRSAVIEQIFDGRYALFVGEVGPDGSRNDRLRCLKRDFLAVYDLAILYQHDAHEMRRRQMARLNSEKKLRRLA